MDSTESDEELEPRSAEDQAVYDYFRSGTPSLMRKVSEISKDWSDSVLDHISIANYPYLNDVDVKELALSWIEELFSPNPSDILLLTSTQAMNLSHPGQAKSNRVFEDFLEYGDSAQETKATLKSITDRSKANLLMTSEAALKADEKAESYLPHFWTIVGGEIKRQLDKLIYWLTSSSETAVAKYISFMALCTFQISTSSIQSVQRNLASNFNSRFSTFYRGISCPTGGIRGVQEHGLHHLKSCIGTGSGGLVSVLVPCLKLYIKSKSNSGRQEIVPILFYALLTSLENNGLFLAESYSAACEVTGLLDGQLITNMWKQSQCIEFHHLKQMLSVYSSSKTIHAWRWCRAIDQCYLSDYSGVRNLWISRVLGNILKIANPKKYGGIMKKKIFEVRTSDDNLARNVAKIIWNEISYSNEDLQNSKFVGRDRTDLHRS